MSENNNNDIGQIANQQCIINGNSYPSVEAKDNIAMAVSRLLFWLTVLILSIGLFVGGLASLLCELFSK